MDTFELKIAYKELLDTCCANGCTYFEDRDVEEFCTWIDNNLEEGSLSSVFGSSGATKAVLYNDLPYVIKIPLMKDNESLNYCAIEYENYLAAIEIPEIADCFAWMDFLFEYKGLPIYIMEKVECNEWEISDKAYAASFEWACAEEGIDKGSEKYDKFCDEFSSSYYNWEVDAQIDCLLEKEWGFKSIKAFNDFCWEHDINDRHMGNWGYRKNGCIVIIDYSGYFGR